MVKVRKKGKNSDVCEMSLLIERDEEFHEWDDNDLIKSIMEEVEIAESTATDISNKVKDKIREVASSMGWDSVPTSLIREFVSNEIAMSGKKYKKKVNKYHEIGLSAKELKQLIESDGSGENSNMTNNPEAVNFNIAEIILKKYALQEIFSKEVASAHYNGDIHIHDLGSVGAGKFYAFSKKTRIKCIINEEFVELSLYELWEKIKKKEEKVNNTQYVKDTSDISLYTYDRGNVVKIERLIISKEEKNMVDFVVENSYFSVTEDHGCVVYRNNEIIIIRADEVKKTDKFLSLT